MYYRLGILRCSTNFLEISCELIRVSFLNQFFSHKKTKKFYPIAPTPFVYRDLLMYCLCTNGVALIEVSFIKSKSGFFYSSKVDVSDVSGIMMTGMNSISVACKTNCCVHTCYIGSFDSSKQTLSVCVVEFVETKEYS